MALLEHSLERERSYFQGQRVSGMPLRFHGARSIALQARLAKST